MDNFNKGFDSSSLSFKPKGNKSNDENELKPPQMTSMIKSPRTKQFPTKNFMNSTISATIKASEPRKKILGVRNETIEHSSFGSRFIKSSAVVDSDGDMDMDLAGGGTICLQPYDPVKNYLSPRPKFLRYNPNRRRNRILILQENDEDRVKVGTYFDVGNGSGCIPSSDLQLGFLESCSQQVSVEEETHDVNNEEDEECEEELSEFEEDSLSGGFLKFLFVVIAVVLSAQAICSMNSPSVSQTLESVSDWHYDVVHGFNFSEVGYGLLKEPDLLVGDFYGHSYYGSDMSEEVVVQDAKTDDHDDDSNDEILQEQDYAEAETDDDFNQDGLTEEDESDVSEYANPQLTDKAEPVVVALEDQEFDDIKTNDVLIKFTSFYPIIAAVLTVHILILTSFSVIYCSKLKKSSAAASVTTPDEKEEFKNPESMMKQKEVVVTPLQNDISKVHIPSVELLGEFVFCEEITSSNVSTENHSTNSLIQTTADSFSQTIKKQRRKNAEVVTPSSVRRSSRLRTRSVMSP